MHYYIYNGDNYAVLWSIYENSWSSGKGAVEESKWGYTLHSSVIKLVTQKQINCHVANQWQEDTVDNKQKDASVSVLVLLVNSLMEVC